MLLSIDHTKIIRISSISNSRLNLTYSKLIIVASVNILPVIWTSVVINEGYFLNIEDYFLNLPMSTKEDHVSDIINANNTHYSIT